MDTGEKWFAVLATSVFILGVYCLGMVARSDGKIDHCWIEVIHYQTPAYAIKGHRNWRPDVTIAIAPTVEEAEAKRKLLCP